MNFWNWIKQGFQRRLAYSTGLILMVVLLAATLFIFRPMLSSWQDRLFEREQLLHKLTRDQELVARKDALLGELTKYEAKFRRRQPHEEEVTSFLKQLDEFSAASSMRINDVRPLSKEERNGLDVISVELTGEGGMAQLVHFLYALSAAEDLLEVRSMTITPRKRGDGLLAITAQISKTLFLG